MGNVNSYDLNTSRYKMIYFFYPMLISGHQHYSGLKVIWQQLTYILCGQLVCYALNKDGGKNHKSAYLGNKPRPVTLPQVNCFCNLSKNFWNPSPPS